MQPIKAFNFEDCTIAADNINDAIAFYEGLTGVNVKEEYEEEPDEFELNPNEVREMHEECGDSKKIKITPGEIIKRDGYPCMLWTNGEYC